MASAGDADADDGDARTRRGWRSPPSPHGWRDKVAEQLLGRRRSDGSPLGRDDPQGNRFLYRSREFPPVCLSPAAHIRRANPRDDMTFAADVVPRHVIFRRGYPYADGDEQGPPVHGLLRRPAPRSSRFVQARWLGDGDRFGLGPEQDGLVGSRPVEAHGPAFVTGSSRADRPCVDPGRQGSGSVGRSRPSVSDRRGRVRAKAAPEPVDPGAARIRRAVPLMGGDD